MGAVEDRLTFVEGRVREQDIMQAKLETSLEAMHGDMNRRFASVDARFDRVDARFDRVDARFDLLDAKMSRQFVWLAGLLVMALVAMLTMVGSVAVSAG